MRGMVKIYFGPLKFRGGLQKFTEIIASSLSSYESSTLFTTFIIAS